MERTIQVVAATFDNNCEAKSKGQARLIVQLNISKDPWVLGQIFVCRDKPTLENY